MKYPIAFLLGAGASLPYGIPMMTGFYAEFRSYVERRHPHCMPLMQQFEKADRHPSPDLETLLSDLELIQSTSEGLSLLGGLTQVVSAQTKLAEELRGYLDAFIVDTCERFDRRKAARELKTLVDFYSYGPLYIFTTNYDRILETVCAENGIAYSDGFESAAGQPVGDWSGRFDREIRIVKLHGSVNWYIDDPGGALHRLDRGYSLPSYEFRLVRGGQRLRALMIIPTLEKEALGDPYIQLAMHFTDVIRETRVLVVAGSSLRDRHIRSYIRSRMETLHVLLVGPLASERRNVFEQPDRTHVVDTGFSEFVTLGRSAVSRLGERLASMPNGDNGSVGPIIEEFIVEFSSIVQEEELVGSNPDFALAWRQTRDPGVATRARSVTSLAQHSHPAVLRRLTEIARSDESESVRVSAVTALARLGSVDVIAVLGSILTTDTSRMVQIEAALGLGGLKNYPEALAYLQQAQQAHQLTSAARSVIADALA